MTDRSELALLVETESRLDRAIVAARQTAEAKRDAARARARTATSTVDEALVLARERIAAEIAAETTARAKQIDASTRATVARYERVRGDLLDAIVRQVEQRLLALVEEDP